MIKEMYYWLMFFLGKDGKKTKSFEFDSYLIVSMLVGFNILTILIVIPYFLGIRLKELGIDKPTTQLIGIIFGLLVVITNYFYLYKNHKKICQKYDELKGARRITGMICFWIYALLSFGLLFTLGPALT